MGTGDDRNGAMNADAGLPFRMSDELLRQLRERVASQYYDQPQIIDLIARAILHAHGLYPS